ncbi:interleukin-1 receptor-associated kinase-like 2 isoform X2 [Leucoraja erinacea]|uniref:interleukin-1 receptor-associated kinase-like 2 isoform X2 n=1 Tax=Leucoraja erinaceus TaxID=7782 RepID=UPI002458A4EF|nr:interleukin-1 receptor-associated kinase-like 2 isoform X2 [Leucoraja erinacea]
MDLSGRRGTPQQRNYRHFVYDIPAKVMEEFYMVMDALAPGDWRRFGSRIISDQTELRNIELFGRKSNSKTRELMWVWGMKQATVQQLLDILNELQLYRATSVIMPGKSEDLFTVQPVSSHLPVPETPELFQPLALSGASLDCMANMASEICVHKLNPLPGPATSPNYLNTNSSCAKINISSGMNDIGNRPCQETSQPPGLLGGMWSLLDLKNATDNFNERYKVGQGTFGNVYKVNQFNTEYAVKLLNKFEDANLKITGEFFCREVETLFQYRHSNIMALEGYCAENNSYCLIYQYMPNGSLENKLQCKNPADAMLWETRLKIAVGTARAIQYLHHCDAPLIHGNIKSSNILLDEYFTPKLGDFGLVKIGPLRADAHQINGHTTLNTTTLQGPLAYLPDEFIRHRCLSEKVDTFSFGIVLSEILTGMKAVDEGRQPALLKDLMLGELELETDTEKTANKICQKYLDRNGDLLSLSFAIKFAVIACLCIKKKKLKMNEVYSMLEQLDHDLKHCDMHSSPGETENVACKLYRLALCPRENTEILSPFLDPINDIKSLRPQSATNFKDLQRNSEPDAKLLQLPCESDESDIFCYHHDLLSCKLCKVKIKSVCSDYSSCSNRTEDNSKTNTHDCKSNLDPIETESTFFQELSHSSSRVSKSNVPSDYSSTASNGVCEFPAYPKDSTAYHFNHMGANYNDCSKSYCCNSDISPMLSLQRSDRVTNNSGFENTTPSRDPSQQSFDINELNDEVCAFEHSLEHFPGLSNGTSPVFSSSNIKICPHKKKLLDKIHLYEEGRIDSAELFSTTFVTEE